MDVGNFMYGSSESDPRGGFAYEYLQSVASYTDWEYEYVYGYWDYLYNLLLKGEIDVLTDVSYIKEREKFISYPEYPMCRENYYLYAHKDDESINPNDLTSLSGKTMQLEKGNYQYQLFKNWQEENNVSLNIFECLADDSKEKAFEKGFYDLCYSIDLSSVFDWEPVAKIGSSDVYMVVNKNRKDLLKDLNRAQQKLYSSNPYYNNNLWLKYFSDLSVTKRLSAEEKEWINSKEFLNVGCFTNDYIFTGNSGDNENSSFIDDIMSDYKKKFKLENLNVKYHYYQTKIEIINALKSGEIDIAFPFLYNLYEAENDEISLSLPFVPTSFSFVYKKGRDYEDLVKCVAVEKGRLVTEYCQSQEIFNSAEFKYYDSVEECLNAVFIGEANCTVIDTNVTGALLFGRNKYKNLSMLPIEKRVYLCFAMNKMNENAISCINKLISVLKTGDLQVNIMKYSVLNKQYTLEDFIDDYLSIIIALLFVLLFLAVALGASVYHIKMLINYDVLTKLLNRRSLKNYIYNYVERANQKKGNFCLVIFDIDNFKHINDTYGHDFGDEVLKLLAEVIQKGISLEDKAFRWGGEEFILLLSADKILAEKIANRIRVNFAGHVFENNGEEFFVTLTGGVSEYKEGMDYKTMFTDADKKLYRGKEMGKNIIIG